MLKVGEVLNLSKAYDEMSRRRLLKLMGAIGAGTVSLSQMIATVYGEEPEGVPIVHTVGKGGEPKRVRIITEERYRRIQVYQELPVDRLIQNNPNINAISISPKPEGESGLAIEFLLDDDSPSIRAGLPDDIDDVPVVYTKKPRETEFEDLEGGSSISSANGGGTATLVCYDQVTNDRVVITADHVPEGASTLYYDGDPVADIAYRDSGTDTTSYKIRSGVNVDVRGTIYIPDISGAWTFAGLSDQVGQTDDGDDLDDGDPVPVELWGSTSGFVSDRCNNTKRDDRIEYQADMETHSTADGDSGGPWVDSDGNLLASHVGYDYDPWRGTEWSVGSVGAESLSRVNAKLYY